MRTVFLTEIVYSIFYVCSETGRLRRNWVMLNVSSKYKTNIECNFFIPVLYKVVFSPCRLCFPQCGKTNT